MIIPKGNLIDLINFVYLNLVQNYGNINYMVSKVILVLKNINVEKISNIVIDRLSDDTHIYISSDSVDSTEGQSRYKVKGWNAYYIFTKSKSLKRFL